MYASHGDYFTRAHLSLATSMKLQNLEVRYLTFIQLEKHLQGKTLLGLAGGYTKRVETRNPART